MQETTTKLYVLTGFLGSGKTTVLLKLLDNWELMERFFAMMIFRW